MNTWRSRIATGLTFAAAFFAHAWLMQFRPHNEWGMTLFYASAAFFDWSLFRACPWFIRGTLCTDMMASCVASAALNAIGWGLYMAYVPHEYYVVASAVLSTVQAVRLLIPDNGAYNSFRSFILRRPAVGLARPVSQKEKR